MDDIVIEFKVRMSGLTYDQAAQVRDKLRNAQDISTVDIMFEISAIAQEVAPEAEIRAFAPYCEWRPARGKRQHHKPKRNESAGGN